MIYASHSAMVVRQPLIMSYKLVASKHPHINALIYAEVVDLPTFSEIMGFEYARRTCYPYAVDLDAARMTHEIHIRGDPSSMISTKLTNQIILSTQRNVDSTHSSQK